MNDPATKNAKGAMESDKDMPISWIRDYGKGQGILLRLRHNNEVIFIVLQFCSMYLDGIQFALGDLNS